jgi:DnaJ-class molecular chaperone
MMLGMAHSAFAADSWTVNINGSKSKLVPIVSPDGTVVVPLNFPTERQENYTLSIKTDKVAHVINVTRTLNKAKTRDTGMCAQCNGTGLCQKDYQAGSGIGNNGTACVVCGGTGKCWYCNGTGTK